MSIDLRTIPAYGILESAHYMRVPLGSLRSWVFGKRYITAEGTKRSHPIINLPDKNKPLLSFLNLAEVYVLDAIRRGHSISLQKVRKALNYLKKEYSSKRPLIEHTFETDGLDLFITFYGNLVNISSEGQIVMKEIIQAYLKRIEYDEKGLVKRLFPFTRRRELNEPKVIVIDPYISFGRPVLDGTGITTTIIAERYKAGESIDELARDYKRNHNEIEDAIRCELEVRAA